MKIEPDSLYIKSLYNKARESFSECINSEENAFLQEEISVPLNSLVLKERNVKIVFSREITTEYVLEVSLTLYATDREIGKYIYYEDERGIKVDDSLAFY